MPPPKALSRLIRPTTCSSCRNSVRAPQTALLSSSARRSANDDASKSRSNDEERAATTAPRSDSPFSSLREMANQVNQRANSTFTSRTGQTEGLLDSISQARRSVPSGGGDITAPIGVRPRQEPHHMHVYAHKHNTHITVTRPNREPVFSYSCGNIGFKKGQRSSYDAAFQLAAYVMRLIQDKGLLRAKNNLWEESDSGGFGASRRVEAPIQSLEVVLRGFGKGREAVVKALLGAEGKYLRDKITLISDDTKLKFGGTRSPNPRRLG